MLILTITNIQSKKTGKCSSSKCGCDMYENLRRADCTRLKLGMIESDIPTNSQWLDLSYNYITEIGDSVFLVSLQYN